MWGDILIAFMLAFITSFMITPKTIKLAKKLGAVDSPKDERRINKVVMPRLGGVAVVIGFIVAIAYLLISLTLENQINLTEENYHLKLCGFFIGMAIIAITCFIDDVKGLPAVIKLIMQILAASIVVASGIRINMSNVEFFNKFNDSPDFMITVSTIITLGWIVGITNAINLIDGLDGLSSGISIISCVSMLIIFMLNSSPIVAILLIISLIGALVGFLPYNINPAKTFIGDTGSNFLGYSLAVISIIGVAKTYTALVVVLPIIVLGLPIFDTLFAIVRRIIKNKSIKGIMKADKGHLHHKLLRRGFSQKQSVMMLYAVSASLGMFAIILLESGIAKALSFLLIVVAVLILGYREIADEMRDADSSGEIEGQQKIDDEQ